MPITNDRTSHHLLAMIDAMLREGRDEAAIVRAIEDARREDAEVALSKAA